MKLLIINGSNLNLLGSREPEIYGKMTFEAYLKKLRRQYHEITLEYFQSNIEGEIINTLHKAAHLYEGIIINAGGYSHTSVSIADAVKSIKIPVVEVHISNTQSRETYRHFSYLSASVKGCIMGFGLDSYRLAVESFIKNIV